MLLRAREGINGRFRRGEDKAAKEGEADILLIRPAAFELRRQSIAKRMRAKLQEVKKELRHRMHLEPSGVGRWLRWVVQGWYNYHAVPGNQDRLNAFRDRVTRYWLHAIRRRSQRGRKGWTWERFRRRLVRQWIPSVRIVHPYPTQRLIVTT